MPIGSLSSAPENATKRERKSTKQMPTTTRRHTRGNGSRCQTCHKTYDKPRIGNTKNTKGHIYFISLSDLRVQDYEEISTCVGPWCNDSAEGGRSLRYSCGVHPVSRLKYLQKKESVGK